MKHKYPPERKRVRIQPFVAPESDKWLSDQPESLGRTIDMLVQHFNDYPPDDAHYNADCVKMEVGDTIRYHDGEEWQSTVITELKEEE